MAEIDDAELKTLREGHALLDQLLRDPKTKRTTEQQIKTLHPKTIISDDYDAPALDEIKKLREELAAERKARLEQDADKDLDVKFGLLRRDGGYTDDGLEKVKKIMVDRKIADPLDAAAVYEKLNPPPPPQQPSSFAGTGWGFGAKSDDKDATALFEDEDAWADREAVKVFNEAKQ